MKTLATTSILLMVLVVSVGCAGVPAYKNELQEQTLGFVFYKNNPMPPEPTEAETRAIKHTMSQAQKHERKMLRDLYKNNKDHQIYATRDSDGDGILDYRIGDDGTDGKFMEGDTDIDGDKIENVLDGHPYDKTKGNDDANGNTVPDHIVRMPTT